MTRIVLEKRTQPQAVICTTCQKVYAIPTAPPFTTGHWQRDADGHWWHWHAGYPGAWHPCEGVVDEGLL